MTFYLFRYISDFFKTVGQARFRQSRLGRQFTHGSFRIGHAQFRRFPQLRRHALVQARFLDAGNGPALAHGGVYGLLEIGRFTVDDAVDIVAHPLDDADALKLEIRLGCADVLQEFIDKPQIRNL